MEARPPVLRSAAPDEAGPADVVADQPGPHGETRFPDPTTGYAGPSGPGPWVDAVLIVVVPFTLLAVLGVAWCLLMLWAGRTSPEGMLTMSALVMLVPTGAASALGTVFTIALLQRRGSHRAARVVGQVALLALPVAMLYGLLSLVL